MIDYLEKTCVNLGIKLVYTYNKVTSLSAELRNGTPFIIADMIFKNCPDSIAKAVINFFTDKADNGYYEKVIKDFLKEQFKTNSVNIKYLDLSFLIKSTQSIDMDYKINIDTEKINYNNLDVNDPNLIELDISYINSKNFWGDNKQYKTNTVLRSLKDDELELNIVVLPPVT